MSEAAVEYAPQNAAVGILTMEDPDANPQETVDWLESLDYVVGAEGRERAGYLLRTLRQNAFVRGVPVPNAAITPYVNTIPANEQPEYPGDRALERRIKSLIRWNVMAMVVRANR